MNGNTKVGCKRCLRLIKKTLVRRKSIVVVHFVRFEQTLHLVWVLLWPFTKIKQMFSVVLTVFQWWYPRTFIMQPTAPLQRTADKATSKNLKFSFLKKQQGAIRTDWEIYSCIFYHLCIIVMIFQVANSVSIFQQQYLLWQNTESRWKVMICNHVKSKKIMSPKDDFLTIFDFTLLFFKALSQNR